MRPLAIALFLLAGFSAAHAQARINAIDIIEAGTYRLAKIETISSTSISTGQHTHAAPTLIERKTVIALKSGVTTVIGAKFRIRGTPRGHRVLLRVVWRYPEPGLRNPKTGITKLNDDYNEENYKTGDEQVLYWSLETDWTKVPGTWILEIWDGQKRMLATQAFNLVTE